MDAKIAASHWSDPELQPLDAEMLLTLHWMKTNPDRNDCGAYRFNAALFTVNTRLDPSWHEKTRAALPERFAQDGLWFLYLPFIRECLQLGTALGKNGRPNLGWQALAKPFQALPKPFQGLMAESYPEFRHILPESVAYQYFGNRPTAASQGLRKPLPSPSEGQEKSSIEKRRSVQGSAEGGEGDRGDGVVPGALVPSEEEVLAYAAGYADLSRGWQGIPEAYALNWLAFRMTPKAGPFPRDWQADLNRRFRANVLEGREKPVNLQDKKTAAPSGRLDQLRRELLHGQNSPEQRAALRHEIETLEKPAAHP